MTDVLRPAHVPVDAARQVDLGFRGPADDLFRRFDELRAEGRAVWIDDARAVSLTAVAADGGPVGAWVFTGADDIRAALQRPDLFSSRLGGDVAMIPIFLDPPEHTEYRRLLNPLFSAKVVGLMEEAIRGRMRGLVDGLVARGGCDFVADVGIQFPTRVFTSWMGLPEAETDRFVALVGALIHGDDDPSAREAAFGAAFVALDQLITDRTENPGDDLMSAIIGLDVDGRALSRDELFRIAFLLFLAGLDTVAAALAFAFWHLARTAGDRAAVASDAVSSDAATEEMLRAFSFVNLPRVAAEDLTFAGVAVRAGDQVVLSLPLASRDPATVDDAGDVHLDRPASRQVAFGLGPHRCLGSHLARIEMRVALEEWHSRIPEYELAGPVTARAGLVMGLTELPLRWQTLED